MRTMKGFVMRTNEGIWMMMCHYIINDMTFTHGIRNIYHEITIQGIDINFSNDRYTYIIPHQCIYISV